MKKTTIAVVTVMAVLYVIGKDATKQKEIDELNARLERVKRFRNLYFVTLKETVKKLDREERRETVRAFNNELEFIRITNHI